jgi:hypothetical protein
MSHDWSRKLAEIQAALTAQNERLTTVKETLADLPSHASIELTREWKHAFEEAVDPAVPLRRSIELPPLGAIRA